LASVPKERLQTPSRRAILWSTSVKARGKMEQVSTAATGDEEKAAEASAAEQAAATEKVRKHKRAETSWPRSLDTCKTVSAKMAYWQLVVVSQER
jgi:hypothetical protein